MWKTVVTYYTEALSCTRVAKKKDMKERKTVQSEKH